MHDTGAVGLLEPVEHLGGHLDRERRSERAARADPRGEVAALDELRAEEEDTVVLAVVVDTDHVGGVEPGLGLRLASETTAELRVGGVVRQHHLEGDLAVQHLVERGVDHAHAAGAQLLQEAIATEGLPDDWQSAHGFCPPRS